MQEGLLGRLHSNLGRVCATGVDVGVKLRVGEGLIHQEDYHCYIVGLGRMLVGFQI